MKSGDNGVGGGVRFGRGKWVEDVVGSYEKVLSVGDACLTGSDDVTSDAGSKYRCGRVGRGSQPPSTPNAPPDPLPNSDP